MPRLPPPLPLQKSIACRRHPLELTPAPDFIFFFSRRSFGFVALMFVSCVGCGWAGGGCHGANVPVDPWAEHGKQHRA